MWKLADESHDSEIIEMSLALYREDPSPHEPTAKNIQKTLKTLRAEPVRGRAVVLEIDGHIVGYSFLISFWSNELGGEVCHLDEGYVKPAHRSQGHGHELLRMLIEQKDKNPLWPGMPVVFELEVTPANARARVGYEKAGFKPMKNLKLRRPNKALDA